MPHHRVTWSGATSSARRANGTPPRDADGNTPCTRAAEDVGPYHAPPPRHLVGRDVPGAPRQRNAPWGRRRERHGDAGRRGRRPLPCPTTVPPGRARRPRRAAPTERPPGTPTGTPRVRGPPRTSAPTTRPCRPRLTPPCASARCRARRRPAPPRRPRPWAARSGPAHTDSGCLR